ncbi:MAG: hypothetical protein KBC30_01885 [Planctomycetes bacterium]|jgi:hypothetical protein|nr:hypothetical protein [Planctomycetota bacterium]HON43720.1 YdjY domain-containing protein [Planctomycetota bacterium]HPY74360.1 YdjY domain-containing protein [Planctomycetota bacterium]HQA99874.1 YdjY domain-containing protein [Planctomycetota bacterium]HRU51531.1 YdjY domain-containing protein [Planctomycetota bacterium]
MTWFLFLICFCNVIFSQTIELPGIKVFYQEKKIEIQGIVNQQCDFIELLATTPGGKEHESLLVLYCNPAIFHSALLMIGLQPGQAGKYQGDTFLPTGDSVYLYVRYNQVQHNVEKWVWDKKHQTEMKQTPWIFTGSRFIQLDNGKHCFAANLQGVLIATFHDPYAILNNPLPERIDDTIYCVNSTTTPPKGTPITLIITTRKQ